MIQGPNKQVENMTSQMQLSLAPRSNDSFEKQVDKIFSHFNVWASEFNAFQVFVN